MLAQAPPRPLHARLGGRERKSDVLGEGILRHALNIAEDDRFAILGREFGQNARQTVTQEIDRIGFRQHFGEQVVR